MPVTDTEVVDGIARVDSMLIMEIYDHLDFEGKFEFDHLTILQDKLNTYLWFIDSKQYEDVYPDEKFSKYIIKVYFLYDQTDNCKKYIDVANQKLEGTNIEIVSIWAPVEELL